MRMHGDSGISWHSLVASRDVVGCCNSSDTVSRCSAQKESVCCCVADYEFEFQISATWPPINYTSKAN
jgi:hypothetical protein